MLDALRSLALLGCTAVLLLAVRVTAAPGGGDFDDCGLLVQGPVCVMFQADGGGTYYVEDLTVFQPGDRVRVSGGLFSQPAVCLPPQCTGMYDGCILGNTIEPCVSAVFFCFGDGGDQLGCTDCPCGNTASVGSVGGCLNGAGASGELVAFGEARHDLNEIAGQMPVVELLAQDRLPCIAAGATRAWQAENAVLHAGQFRCTEYLNFFSPHDISLYYISLMLCRGVRQRPPQ